MREFIGGDSGVRVGPITTDSQSYHDGEGKR